MQTDTINSTARPRSPRLDPYVSFLTTTALTYSSSSLPSRAFLVIIIPLRTQLFAGIEPFNLINIICNSSYFFPIMRDLWSWYIYVPVITVQCCYFSFHSWRFESALWHFTQNVKDSREEVGVVNNGCALKEGECARTRLGYELIADC